MKETVKGVVFIDDAINLSHDELKKKFKEAVDKDEINHFEIQTRGKEWNVLIAMQIWNSPEKKIGETMTIDWIEQANNDDKSMSETYSYEDYYQIFLEMPESV